MHWFFDFAIVFGWLPVYLLLAVLPAHAQLPLVLVTVNSNQDGPIQADNILTLREAIEVVNGTLAIEQLSAEEKAGGSGCK